MSIYITVKEVNSTDIRTLRNEKYLNIYLTQNNKFININIQSRIN